MGSGQETNDKPVNQTKQNNMKSRTISFALLGAAMLLACEGAIAQSTKQQALEPVTRTGGIYHSYEGAPEVSPTPTPKGYKPFYISHFGRHGSRWHTSDRYYKRSLSLLEQAEADDMLTEKGKELLEKVRILSADAKDRYGALSPRGVREHRGIAERMYYSFPEVFSTRGGRDVYIECRSTLYPRVILSMAAFNERLKELNPELRISRESAHRYELYLTPMEGTDSITPLTEEAIDRFTERTIHPQPFLARILKDPSYPDQIGKDPVSFMKGIYMLASITQDVDYLNLSLYDIFTEDELFDLWQVYNLRFYLQHGPSPEFGKAVLADMKPLLQNIVASADSAIVYGTPAATLRFGHDVNITPLGALIGLEGLDVQESDPNQLYLSWSSFLVSPMAANLQIIFYRKNKNNDDILVKFLYNEHERTLPIVCDTAPYYPWEEVRAYLLQQIAKY